ncbi:MAG TPA: FAD:protein FMN transferase [Clostridiaceae bacterium]|nr:FAD:protein FMN transferase [Clostridiaceae bacterium]
MNTIITQRIYGKNAKKATQEATERIKELESKMTINSPGGEVNDLNAQAGKGFVSLTQDTVFVLEKALYYSELSGGAFDVTVGPLVKAWGINTPNERIPSENEIEELLTLVNYKDINIDRENLQAKLERPGQIVDLGAIAKGYAGDEVIKIYKKYGIESAYVNLGGNVVVLGTKPDGTPWRIGIQDPRKPNGFYVAILTLVDKAVVTSGDYERYFERDGKRYHHIIDPRTGSPSHSGLISATIVSDSSIDADALSTSVFILGLDKGMELIESLPGIEAVFITENKEVYVTSGLTDYFSMAGESRDYKYVEKR